MDFAVGLVNAVVTCNSPNGQVKFFGNSNYRRTVINNLFFLNQKSSLGYSEWLLGATACLNDKLYMYRYSTLSSKYFLFTWVTSELKVMWTCCRFCEIVLNDLDYSALHHLSLIGCKSTLSLFFVDVWKFHRRLWTQVTWTKFAVLVYGSTWRSFFFSSYMYVQMII